MYVNVNLLKSRNLSLHEFAVLSLLRQNKFENNIDLLEKECNIDVLKKFNDLGLIEQVKRKNKAQNELELIRTTKKGNEWLDDINTAEICEDSLKIYNWIAEIYRQSGKELGNQKKTKQFVAQFSKESGIEKNSLAFLIQSFVNDESQFEWSKVLQFLFFKGDSVFSVRFDLHSSRLYQYFLKNENYFLEKFKKWEE
jgi:hypothetical protein